MLKVKLSLLIFEQTNGQKIVDFFLVCVIGVLLLGHLCKT